VLVEVLSAQAVSRASAGAFDVTVAPLVGAWGFGAGARRIDAAPADADLDALLASVGYGKLELRESPPALRKSVARLRIDLDGIAPGYVVDRIAARLEVPASPILIELGGRSGRSGSMLLAGAGAGRGPAPESGGRTRRGTRRGRGSTSGDYRDFREVDGRRVSHTIDPRTGRPVAHRLASVSVVHASVATADAWATALMVLGPEEGTRVARRLGLAALFIERDAAGAFRETATPAFASLRRPLPREI
jgi:thiamine biosynthesis lipoprotein